MTPAQSNWRVRLLLGASGLGLGAAAWLTPASQYIVAWSDEGPVRVALLAPPVWLFPACMVSVGLVWALAWRWGRSDVHCPTLLA